ncbi:MAG: cytochrome C oxidase subunit IV family protein [Fimbriimonas sp.]
MASTPLTSGGDHHVTPISVYVKTILALIVLMALTVWASFWNIPDVGPIHGNWIANILALTIAVTKALLVVMFFMGVKYASSLTRLWVAAGFIVLGVMYFISGDHLTRKYEVVPGWNEAEGSALPRVFDPLNQTPPREVDTNVRPRQ